MITMSYQVKSNSIVKLFQQEIGLTLFQKQKSGSFNLIAMNSGRNGPYTLPPKLKGVSVAISFQHETGASIEVYFKTEFYNNVKESNPTFDIFSKHFKGRDLITKTKVDGDFQLFLMPIDQLDSVEDACHILNDICLDLNGIVRE